MNTPEAHYRQLFEATQIGMLVLDRASGQVVDANPFMLEMLGYPSDEVLGRKLKEIPSFSATEAGRRAAAELERADYVRYGDLALTTKSGAAIHVELIGKARLIDRRRLVPCLVRDITEQKSAERERAKLQHDLGERVKEETTLFRLSQVLADKSAPPEAVMARTVELLPPAWQYPEVACARIEFNGQTATAGDFRRTPWRQAVEFRVGEKACGSIEVCYLEERPAAAEGPFLAEERALLRTIGEMVRTYFERHLTENALRRSDLYFRALTDNALGLVAVIAPNGAICYANRAFKRVLDWAPEEVLGRRALDFVHPDDAEGFQTFLKSAAPEAGAGAGAEFRVRDKAGGWHVLDSVARNLTQDPVVAGVVINSRDVTERKRAEEALHRLSGRFMRVQDEERRRMARELHDTTAQSLVALCMYLKLLSADDRSLKPEAREALANCLALAERSANEVRTFSYLLHPPLLDELGLAGAIRDYVAGFSRRSGIRVTLDLAPDIGRLPRETELALFRVLQESLTNVHRHSGGTAASVILAKEGEEIRMEVRDNGKRMGITAKLPAAADPAGTLGVGIAGMHERLRQLGGRLELESSPKGTTVRAIVLANLQGNTP